MFKPDAIQTAAWRVLNPLMPAGLQLLHSFQGDTETKDYASLAISTRQRQGQDTRVDVSAAGVQMYRGQRGGTITLQIVSDDCNTLADTIINSLQMESASGLFRQHGIVMHSANAITFDPIELEGGQYMQLAVIDMQWRATVEYYDNVGLIEYVVAHHNIRTDGGQDNPGGFVVALDGGTAPPELQEVYKVFIPQPDTSAWHVGAVVAYPEYFMRPAPVPGSLRYVDVQFAPDGLVIDVGTPGEDNHQLQLLQAGDVTMTVRVVSASGYEVSDSITLQINP